MRQLICALFVLATTVYFSEVSIAAEHPGTPAESEHLGTTAEHPGKPAEHPGETAEHPGETAEHPGKEAMLSADEIIKGIKDNINKVTQVNAGYFPLFDSQDSKALRLKLVKVHEDRVSYIKKDNAYFACTDFKTDDGKTTYDIDFWMKTGTTGKLEVYQTKIHKKDGKPRFVYQDDEIVPVESQMAPEEHT